MQTLKQLKNIFSNIICSSLNNGSDFGVGKNSYNSNLTDGNNCSEGGVKIKLNDGNNYVYSKERKKGDNFSVELLKGDNIGVQIHELATSLGLKPGDDHGRFYMQVMNYFVDELETKSIKENNKIKPGDMLLYVDGYVQINRDGKQIFFVKIDKDIVDLVENNPNNIQKIKKQYIEKKIPIILEASDKLNILKNEKEKTKKIIAEQKLVARQALLQQELEQKEKETERQALLKKEADKQRETARQVLLQLESDKKESARQALLQQELEQKETERLELLQQVAKQKLANEKLLQVKSEKPEIIKPKIEKPEIVKPKIVQENIVISSKIKKNPRTKIQDMLENIFDEGLGSNDSDLEKFSGDFSDSEKKDIISEMSKDLNIGKLIAGNKEREKIIFSMKKAGIIKVKNNIEIIFNPSEALDNLKNVPDVLTLKQSFGADIYGGKLEPVAIIQLYLKTKGIDVKVDGIPGEGTFNAIKKYYKLLEPEPKKPEPKKPEIKKPEPKKAEISNNNDIPVISPKKGMAELYLSKIKKHLQQKKARLEKSYKQATQTLSISNLRALGPNKSETGTTLCSQDARMFLQDKVAHPEKVAWQPTALESMRAYRNKKNYANKIQKLPKNVLLDIFPISQDKENGHRAAGFINNNGEKFIFDSYIRSASNKDDPTLPIPWDEYFEKQIPIGIYVHKIKPQTT